MDLTGPSTREEVGAFEGPRNVAKGQAPLDPPGASQDRPERLRHLIQSVPPARVVTTNSRQHRPLENPAAPSAAWETSANPRRLRVLAVPSHPGWSLHLGPSRLSAWGIGLPEVSGIVCAMTAPDASSPILAHLNEPQREAVTHIDGPLCVLAGAGSGKTRVITHRIAWMIEQGVAPESILAVTFTNKAAKEMRDRVRALTGRYEVRLATFHGFCATFLREELPAVGRSSDFTIYDEGDAKALMKRVFEDQKIDGESHKPEVVLRRIASWKTARRSVEDVKAELEGTWESFLGRAYEAYEEQRRDANACGFDDLLLDALEIMERCPDVLTRWQERIQRVLVDEFQDTNAVQYALVRNLTGQHRNLCVTGDQDQAIYSWRGADPGNFDRFLEDHADAGLVRLEQNYRSSGNVLRAASAVIACNRHRIPKNLWTEAKDGDPVRVVAFEDDYTEAREVAQAIRGMHAEGYAYGDMAVFYRTNSLSAPIERTLMQERVPYRVLGGLEFFGRQEVKDLLAYLRFLANPRDTVSLLRIINVPARGLGKKTQEQILQIARGSGLPLGEALRDPELFEGLAARARKAVVAFSEILMRLDQVRRRTVRNILDTVIDATGYGTYWETKATKGGSLDPHQNIGQLVNVARDYDEDHDDGALEGFLAQVSLLTDLDRGGEDPDKVNLMTLHTSKGLEFPVVFLVGADEGLLPHVMSAESPGGEEEERRLFHVGLTRAREQLVVTHAGARTRFGRTQRSIPSRFLDEMGEEGVQRFDPPEPSYGGGGHHHEAEDESHPLALLRPGAPVWHPEWGAGKVRTFRGRGQGLDRKAVVAFEDGSERTIILRHSELEPLESWD